MSLFCLTFRGTVVLLLFSTIDLIVGVILTISPTVNVGMSFSPPDADGMTEFNSGVAGSSTIGTILVISASSLTILLVSCGLVGFNLYTRTKWEWFLKLVWIELSWTVVLMLLWFGWLLQHISTVTLAHRVLLATALLVTVTSVTSALQAVGGVSSISVSCIGKCGAGNLMKVLAWLNSIILLLYTVALNGLIASQLRVKQAPAGTSTPPDNPPVPPNDIELANS
jgi:hypothetical protein